MHEFHSRRRIEFVDTDMVGIVHFARFFIFMETTEHQFLEALGTNVYLERDGQVIGWPRVSATCEYLSPARFGDWLDIHLKVVRKGTSSMVIRSWPYSRLRCASAASWSTTPSWRP